MNIPLSLLDTPSLVVDLNAMERNMSKMKSFIDSSPFELRPHAKAHKIPELARTQIAHGAQGICVAKLGEAEVMVDAGIDDVLITCPIANPMKVKRLVELKRRASATRIIQVVDCAHHIKAISEAASGAGITIDLLIEVECGQERCGVAVGPELLELIQLINGSPGVSYSGIQAYTGHIQHVCDYQERRSQARQLVSPLFSLIEKEMTASEFRPEIVSGGGTGTYDCYDGLPFTELQAGSYLFMDWDYHSIGSKSGAATYDDFDCALKVWTTVISKPLPTRAVVDAGMKALSVDSGMPTVDGRPELEYHSGGDEHGILHLRSRANEIAIGTQLMMIPSHCDTTLNQYSYLYGIRDGFVETHWEIAGRGRCD